MTKTCLNLQKSLDWCEGKPSLPGIRRRLYYIAKSYIVEWPSLPKDENGRVTSSSYEGNFTLAADATWKHIDVIADKSGVKSDPQGEKPSQTQKNTLTAIHPGVGEEATAAAAYLNNCNNIFLLQDMQGNFRVVGCEAYDSLTTVAQDLGNGPTGTASTTITCEASDAIPAPFYKGEIITEDGIINPSDTTEE